MVVDIQGVDDLFTDPQIHSLKGDDFGDGNLGVAGMALFGATLGLALYNGVTLDVHLAPAAYERLAVADSDAGRALLEDGGALHLLVFLELAASRSRSGCERLPNRSNDIDSVAVRPADLSSSPLQTKHKSKSQSRYLRRSQPLKTKEHWSHFQAIGRTQEW